MRVISVPLALVLAGCAALAPALGAGSPAAPRPRAARIVVRLTPAAAAARASRVPTEAPLRFGLPSLDALCAQYGVTSLTPLLPAPVDEHAVRAAYPQRSRRASTTQPLPDLSRAYVVTFDPVHAAADIVAAVARDPHIESAQEDYSVTSYQAEQPNDREEPR